MCKIMCVAGIKPEHVEKVEKLAQSSAKIMSRADDDGVGYAAITNTGQVYGEKWLNREEAFVTHSQPKVIVDPSVSYLQNLFGAMALWEKTPEVANSYESFGDVTKENITNTVALILHARKATVGAKTISNVHPFVVQGDEHRPTTALIHNGSIVNHAKLTKTMSSCDSEVLLHEYLGNSMYHNPWGINQLSKAVMGSYAVGVLSSMWDGTTEIPYLDVFKSNKELYAAYVPELETTVFCTSDFSLREALEDNKMTFKNPIKIKDGYLIRLNAITGERIDDLVAFMTSPMYDNSQYSHGYMGMGPHSMKEVTHLDDITPTDDNTLEEAKKQFEKKHPALFNTPYTTPKAQLTVVEKDLFSKFDEQNKPDFKAMRLVALALAARH